MEDAARVRELNRELIRVNAELAAANRRQTARCRRFGGAVALLDELVQVAVSIAGGYLITEGRMERLQECLADIVAAEIEAGGVAMRCAGCGTVGHDGLCRECGAVAAAMPFNQ